MPKKKLLFYRIKIIEIVRRLTSDIISLYKTYPLSPKGFTLIELLVVVGLLGTILGGILFTVNPFTQIERGQDAQRRQDLQQVKNALETYYQDTNCYPQTLNFGEEWSENGAIYMTEVPQDPTCNEQNGYCYEYVTDESVSCPQWNVVFAKLAQSPADSSASCPPEEEPCPQDLTSCPLNEDTCVPEGYDETWACEMSGAVNCQLLSVSGFGYESESATEDLPTPTPTEAIQPTPTLPPGAVTYNLGGGFLYNPYLKDMTIYPLWAEPGQTQTFSLAVEDENSEITDVTVHLYYDDGGYRDFSLSHSGGGMEEDGVWNVVHDGDIQVDSEQTYNEKFVMAIVATNGEGEDAESRCTVLAPRGSEPQADQICDDINSDE